ncbi:MAG: SUMF1/EgtB/PvdO family nonheme iron enzyme, partial [Bacteroidaceae bacterium]|nr:SUMF1/EgtB/PvdO family nonheme iron enzyme [Bacteroidaceae bacterium]
AKSGKGKKYFLLSLGLIILGFSLLIVFNWLWDKSSTSESCMSCHYHTESDMMWKQSMHHNSNSGVKTDCAACHLPPKGTLEYTKAKITTGMQDIWSYLTKDKEEIDWESKGELEHASKIVYNESCKACHVNIYPEGITDDGITAHLYYDENEEKLNMQCISCHLDAGHYNPNYQHAAMTSAPSLDGAINEAAATVTSFENFTETVPGTTATINMIAVPGGSFAMGSSESEPFHKSNEAPQRQVEVSPFFMSEVEITWNQYWAFYAETMSEGRTPPTVIYENNSREDLDAVSGPTPPFGSPDQGWGMGERPAITMTHYAAETFCQWLTLKTGKKYRLPTEAEWEYAARGGTSTPYFFEGSPKDYTNGGFWNEMFGADTTCINSYVIYANNSKNRSQEPGKVLANPFGLKNMLGNVMEYCSDWYAEDAYQSLADGAKDPKGPESGTEYVVRGGSYLNDAADLRCAARDYTRHDDWLRTDPQNPKSIWWYSDIRGIGFRVVCEVPEGI